MVQVNETPSSGKKAKCFPAFIILLFFINFNIVYAQKWEVGGAVGGGNYQGDISPTFRFENYQPAGGLFGRYNFSQTVSVKLGLNLIKTEGSTSFYKDPYPLTRGTNFIRVLGELAGQVEYNFFNYRDEKSRRNWTPYFFVGAGAMYMHGATAGASPIQPVIPTGVGFRYLLGGKWNLGLEMGVRKTFTDYFDRVGYIEAPTQTFNGNPYTKDWYFLSTISISYTFYTIPCPFNFD